MSEVQSQTSETCCGKNHQVHNRFRKHGDTLSLLRLVSRTCWKPNWKSSNRYTIIHLQRKLRCFALFQTVWRTHIKGRPEMSEWVNLQPLYRLDPLLDVNVVLRVGGRIRRGDFSLGVRHPVILPRKGHITELLIRHFHERVAHQGRGMTVPKSGPMVSGLLAAVRLFSYHISRCLKCRRLRGVVQEQKIADLPFDRMDMHPPFTYSGVDFFGPFYIKEGRKDHKRYGVLCTCMASRAINLETANSLDTDSFINYLRRFISFVVP